MHSCITSDLFLLLNIICAMHIPYRLGYTKTKFTSPYNLGFVSFFNNIFVASIKVFGGYGKMTFVFSMGACPVSFVGSPPFRGFIYVLNSGN